MSVRVFIIDSQPAFRLGLRTALDAAGNIAVVGEAGQGEDVIEILETFPNTVDVVLIDIGPGALPGLDTMRLICEGSALRVLALSAVHDDDIIVGALCAGASGVLSKHASGEDLLHSIHLVANGGAAFSAPTGIRLRDYFAAGQRLPGRLAFPELTEREGQVLDLLARGQDNQSIARALNVAEKTVRNNITSVYAKLHVTNRTGAALRARQAGLGVLPDRKPRRDKYGTAAS